MITKNVWMVTWNCENQAPDSATLDNRFLMSEPGWGTAASPDLIVVALQEAVTQAGDYVSTRLAKPGRLGGIGTANGNANLDYVEVEQHHSSGFTKMKSNAIHVGVLARADTSANVTHHSAAHFKDGTEGKGGVCVRLTITEGHDVLRLGFIGAHLDSFDTNKSNNQIKRLLLAITNTAPAGADMQDQANIRAALDAQFDAVFLMGDLNYRLRTSANVPATTTAATMANMINNSIQRQLLFALDSLPASSLVANFGFNFPQPNPLFMPSYPLDYKTSANANPCLRMYQPGSMVQVEDAISACYFDQNDANVYNQERAAFDLGWLDRLGWRLNATAAAPPTVTVNNGDYKSYTDFILSDHAPVLMKATITKP